MSGMDTAKVSALALKGNPLLAPQPLQQRGNFNLIGDQFI
jgi:hypothetical protein